jgi:RNA polymerase sigma-70 factor, ECF subfamily
VNLLPGRRDYDGGMRDDVEQLEDELLVLEWQRGSAAAMEKLVGRWQKRLWRYARRLTGDGEGAWEVTQESWLGMVRGVGRLEDPARFRAWAYRIVTRRAQDWVAGRMKGRREEAMRRESPAGDRQPASEAVESLLRGLPGASQEVLALHYLDGLSLAEVALALAIPEGTVKSRLHTARRELKELLKRKGEEKAF